MLIHVIKPNGTRFEFIYTAGTPDRVILAELEMQKVVFGRTGVHNLTNELGMPVPHQDNTTPWAWDHPNCRVVEVKPNTVEEIRVLRGPAEPVEPLRDSGTPAAASPPVSPPGVPPPAKPARSRGWARHSAAEAAPVDPPEPDLPPIVETETDEIPLPPPPES